MVKKKKISMFIQYTIDGRMELYPNEVLRLLLLSFVPP